MNAWPALRQMVLDGWVLRMAEGYTRRANSVAPLYPGQLPLGDKITECEGLYRREGLPVVFKLTPAALPPGLDAELAQRGYREEGHSSVQLAAIIPREISIHVREWRRVDPQWMQTFVHMTALPAARVATATRMLASLTLPACFAMAQQDRAPVACALGVVQGPHLGIFDVVTCPNQRRRGLGRGIVSHLLNWGHLQGATHAYLQVMLSNLPALALYKQLGFVEQYRYAYRVKE